MVVSLYIALSYCLAGMRAGMSHLQKETFCRLCSKFNVFNSTFGVKKMFNIFTQLQSRILSVSSFQETIRIGLNRQKIV